MNDLVIESDDIRAKLCRMSFYDYTRQFWPVIIEETPVWNWHIKYMCDSLQLMSERMFKWQPKLYDQITNISPGSTKSTVASVMFPGWLWCRKPSTRFIGASFVDSLSMFLSLQSRKVIESDMYRTLFPYIIPRKDQWTKKHFANTRGGSRYSTTVGGSVTGMHGHVIGIDDPLDPEQANSAADLATAKRWVTETMPSRKVDKMVSFMFLIMQRVHEEDPTGVWLAKAMEDASKLVHHIKIPASLDDGDTPIPADIANYYVDGLMDPVRLSRDVLREALTDLGPYGYSGQYRQSPAPREGGVFKAHRIVIDTPPRMFKSLVRYWDKAGTLLGGAYTVGCKMGLDYQDRVWVLDIKREQFDATQREQLIKQTAQIDGKKVVVWVEQEPGSGGKESAEGTVKNLMGYTCKVDIPRGDKAYRADPFSGQVNAGNVYMVEAVWNKAFVDEMISWPRSKYKDQIDASGAAFAKLSEPVIKSGAF